MRKKKAMRPSTTTASSESSSWNSPAATWIGVSHTIS
jgi:hypothetical protein